MVAALVPDNPEQHAQGRQDSNLQPAVLETAALPIAPLPFGEKNRSGRCVPQASLRRRPSSCFQHRRTSLRNNCAYVEPALFRTPACLRKPTDNRQSHSGSGTPGDPLNSIEYISSNPISSLPAASEERTRP